MDVDTLAAEVQAGRGDLLALWEAVRRFALKQAFRWFRAVDGLAGVEVEDLLQVAFLALLDALAGWDAERGTFLNYFGLRLKSHFSEACGFQTERDKRDPIRTALDLDAPIGENEDGTSYCLADIVPDPAAEAAFEDIAAKDRLNRLHDALESALETLPEEQREAIRSCYWERMEVDRRIINKGMRSLRNPRISSGLKVFL